VKRSVIVAALGLLACGRSAPPAASAAPAEEPPVALNAEPVVQYPPDLYDRRVEGDVVLRLFADSSGRIAPESTRVAESSGFAALDTAAVRGVTRLRYAPAYRHGLAIATAFLQTIEFRHPGGSDGPAQPVTASAASATGPSRGDTARVRRDTTRPAPPPRPAPPDTTRARRDTTPPPRDTTAPAVDSAKARPDST
jgi:TonB family protein